MYLTYLDESDTRAKIEKWKVVCAVLVSQDDFNVAEFLSSVAIEELMPDDQRGEFSEFHASELYGGYGVFEKIDQTKRFEAIEWLLGLMDTCRIKVTYGAVDLEFLGKQSYASANPLDMAFRLCVQEVGEWLAQEARKAIETEGVTGSHFGNNFALLIVDECDKSDKVTLQSSFRAMRKRTRPPDHDPGPFLYLHDDMYFGDSRYSIGIQLADLCAYFIARHLSGDNETERFYEMIKPKIFSSNEVEVT